MTQHRKQRLTKEKKKETKIIHLLVAVDFCEQVLVSEIRKQLHRLLQKFLHLQIEVKSKERKEKENRKHQQVLTEVVRLLQFMSQLQFGTTKSISTTANTNPTIQQQPYLVIAELLGGAGFQQTVAEGGD